MIKTLMAAAVAAAFAIPVIAQASAVNDNIVVAQAGGGDTGNSSRQPGANPPGAVSPGNTRDATTAADRDTGAAAHANPSGARGRRESTSGATARASGFDRLDRNHDGYISRDEAANASELNTRFSELDRNNDGKLSRDEYNALSSGKRAAGGATSKSSASGKETKAGAPDKGPGAQEPANRALGTAGSGLPEGGGTSTSK